VGRKLHPPLGKSAGNTAGNGARKWCRITIQPQFPTDDRQEGKSLSRKYAGGVWGELSEEIHGGAHIGKGSN